MLRVEPTRSQVLAKFGAEDSNDVAKFGAEDSNDVAVLVKLEV